jgi:Flp pilus assembly protein TadG
MWGARVPVPPRDSARRAALRLRQGARRSEGQSLVEFSLVVAPLFFILLAIIQFGFIFNSYVTITNAAREAARNGTIYIYDRNFSKTQNDGLRNDAIKATALSSLNLLSKSAPQFTTGSTWTASGGGLTFTNGDVVVTYVLPTGMADTDTRRGQQVTVSMTYHQDLVIPLIGNLLPRDSGGRLRLISQVTMVMN